MFWKLCGRNSQSLNAIKHRNSRPKVFCKKGVLWNFAKFTGKHLCHSPFFNKVAETLAQVFSYEFYEITKNKFFHRTALVAVSESNRYSHFIWNSFTKSSALFFQLFLTKVTISMNVFGVLRESALNCCLMARSFLLFHICCLKP